MALYTQLRSEKERRVKSRNRIARKRIGKVIWHSRDSRVDFEVAFAFVSVWACTSSDESNRILHSYFAFTPRSTPPSRVTALDASIAPLSLTSKITHAGDWYLQRFGKSPSANTVDYNLVQSIVEILPWWKAVFAMPSLFFFFLSDFFNFGVLQKCRG